MGPGMKLQRFVVHPTGQKAGDAPLTEDCGEAFWFWCPGCETHHSYRTKRYKGEVREDGKTPVPLWTFNGDMEKPTFSACPPYTASLLYAGWQNQNGKMVGRCHLYLVNGVLDFLADCDHKYKGTKVPLGAIP